MKSCLEFDTFVISMLAGGRGSGPKRGRFVRMSRGHLEAVLLFRRLFAAHRAHMALLDLEGLILSVNNAWLRFGELNGLDPRYRFEECDYLAVCHSALLRKSPYAEEAMVGLARVLKAGDRAFSMLYPCHSPTEPRWFRMWVQSQQPEVAGVVVAHSYIGPDLSSVDESEQADRPAKGDRPVVLNAAEYPWLHMGFNGLAG